MLLRVHISARLADEVLPRGESLPKVDLRGLVKPEGVGVQLRGRLQHWMGEEKAVVVEGHNLKGLRTFPT